MKMSRSALFPSVNRAGQQICAAHGGDNNKEFGDHSSALSLPVCWGALVNCQRLLWGTRCLCLSPGLVLPLLCRAEDLTLHLSALTSGLYLLRLDTYTLFLSPLPVVLLPPAFLLVITVCKIRAVSTCCVFCRQWGARGWEACRELPEGISVFRRTAGKGCVHVQTKPNVQTLLAIPFMRSSQSLL